MKIWTEEDVHRLHKYYATRERLLHVCIVACLTIILVLVYF